MFLLLQAGESLVHPLHYSVAAHFHQNISQPGRRVLISERARERLSKEQA